MVMFERLTGKSYFKMTPEDGLMAMYATLVSNNDLNLTYKAFLIMVENNKKFAKWLSEEYQRIENFTKQFKHGHDNASGETPTEVPDIMAGEMAASLMINYGLDAHYVMKEMELWELEYLHDAAEKKRKAELIEKRDWLYYQVAPQLDSKKIKTPEQYLSFPWEKADQKEKQMQKLESEKDNIKRIIGSTLNV